MDKSYQYLDIDINKKIYKKLNAVQGDTKSRYILVSLYNNSIAFDLSECSVKVFGVKADKKIFFNYANITDTSKGQFEIELTSQALAVDGELKIQILVLGANQERLTTCTFFVDVDKTIVNDNAIESENEFTALTKGLSELAEYDIYKNNILKNSEDLANHKNNILKHNEDLIRHENNILKHNEDLIRHENKFNEINLRLSQLKNVPNRYVDINDFNNITEAIEYAKVNNKKILADKIILTENVNFRGVELEIDVLDIDKYSIELGGYYTPDVEGQAKTNPPQRINKILRDTDTPNGEEQVFIRGSVGQFITIGQYYGSVNFRMNETDTHNAYSTYTFGYVWKITIDNDTWASSSPSVDLWMNENTFHINRCNHFIMKGTFPHDLNRIYGGCFEQKSSIEIYAGRHNYFYDMRFEGRKSVNIIFAEGTIGNVIYRNDLYYINIVDNGRQNAVIYKEQNNYRLINNYSIKADTFNTSYLNGFKNLIPTSDRLGFKPTSDGQIEILETEFIPNPKNAMFTATCSRKVGNGLAVKYKIYDSNFKEITNLSSKQFFMVTTNESSMTNFQEGNYRSPGDQSANSKDCANGVFNDVVTLYPTSYFVSDGSNIKYVKFFIISSSYFNPDAEYYDMSASIYNIAGNYNRYYIL